MWWETVLCQVGISPFPFLVWVQILIDEGNVHPINQVYLMLRQHTLTGNRNELQ